MANFYEEKKDTSGNYLHLFTGGEKAPIIKEIVRKNWGRLLLSFLLYVIKDSPVYIVPICTSNIINVTTSVLEGKGPENYWLPIIINSIVIVVSLLQNIFTHTLYARLTDNMLRNISAGVREAVVRKLQHISISCQKEMESGDLQWKFLRDIDGVEGYFSTILKVFVPSIITAIIAFGIAVYENWKVALFFVVVIPLNVLLVQLFNKRIQRDNHDYRMANESLSKRFSTMIEMMPITQAHGLQENEISAMDLEVKDVRSKGLRVDYTTALFGSSMWVVSGLLSFSCVIFTIYLALQNQIGIGDVVLYQSLFANITGRISTIVNVVPALGAGRESLASLEELMSIEEIQDDTSKLHLENVQGQVDFDHVAFQYPGSSKDAITDFSLHVKPGESIAFAGPSGSGKTTIVNLLTGLLTPKSGSVSVDGHNLEDLSMKDYRRHLSVVPQNPILFKGSIKDNITYGLSKYTDEDVEKALSIANCDEFIAKLPGGVNYQIDEHGGNLSGGQKQRITIARAIIRNPEIIIFDEATSALDNIAEAAVQEAIASSTEGRTTFVIAHRISTIQGADRILYIEDGKVLEEGNYEELMAKQGRFYTMQNASLTRQAIESKKNSKFI